MRDRHGGAGLCLAAVDGSDLGLVLARFDCPTPCDGCLADLTLDGIIDAADLGLVLANWGAECECFSCESSFAAAATGNGAAYEEALAEALLALGFGSLANYQQWSAQASAEQQAAALEWLAAYLLSKL